MDLSQSKNSLLINQLNKKPVLSTYTDYRRYLHDFYNFKRIQTSQSVRPYAYADFAAAANIKSPNYLKLIIDGRRNLSAQMMTKFSKALGHSKAEANEFAALVKYSQAKTPAERNQHLKVLADIRVEKQIKEGQLLSTDYEKVPSWVTWVLHAMTDQKNVKFDVESLRNIMRNKASEEEIKTSLNGLVERGEVQIAEDGSAQKAREVMSGRENVPVELIRKLQAELIYLGLESLFQDRPQDREFGAMTASLTEDEFDQLKFELRQLRKKWSKNFSVNRHQAKGDRVFQLNIQLFPITKATR
ncbi:MAG: TIGR02147 family protein [Bdellovibrionales bacterium]|nr:TIGR02147 family protein [Bdellovibrionales bacterium]